MQVISKVQVSDWMTDEQRKEFKCLAGRYIGFNRFDMSDGTNAGKISYTFEDDMLSEIEIGNPEVGPAKLVFEIVDYYRNRKTKRSQRAKRAAQTRIKRQNMKICEAARELISGRLKLTGSSTHCRICGKALTDEPSINREVGPECWSRVMRTVEAVKISDMGLDQEDFDMIGFYDPKTGSIEGLDVFDIVALKFGVTTKYVCETVARAYAIWAEDKQVFHDMNTWPKFCEMGKDIALDDTSAERVLISMKSLFDAVSLKIKSKPFDPYKLDDGKIIMERSGLSRDDYNSYQHLEPDFFDDTETDVTSFPIIANAAYRDIPLVQMAAAEVAFNDAQW